MRGAIREKIIQGIPEIQGRVYEIQVPTKDTVKPYVILKQGIDVISEDWLGYKRGIDVILYHKRTTFKDLDALAQKIIQVLDKQLIVDNTTQEAFTCFFEKSSIDYIDDEWNAITRTLSFSILALRPYIIEEYTESDEAVKAIATYTKEKFPTWHIYESIFPAGYILPCVVWRLEKTFVEKITSIHNKIRKILRGHILGRTLGEQEEMAQNILKSLRKIVKLQYLDKFYTIEDIDYISTRDKFLEGQISLSVYYLDKFSQDVRKISKVNVKGGI